MGGNQEKNQIGNVFYKFALGTGPLDTPGKGLHTHLQSLDSAHWLAKRGGIHIYKRI